jgi:hypothetical protein
MESRPPRAAYLFFAALFPRLFFSTPQNFDGIFGEGAIGGEG